MAGDRHTGGGTPTSAQAVRPSEDPALLDLSERGEHDPDVVLVALLRHHANEQLPVLHRCGQQEGGQEEGELGEAALRRKSLGIYFQTI